MGTEIGALAILSHTDLALANKSEDVAAVKDRALATTIDKAHHFRNPGSFCLAAAEFIGHAWLECGAPHATCSAPPVISFQSQLAVLRVPARSRR